MSMSSRSLAAALLAAACTAGACSSEPETPPVQSQTQSTQQLNTPATLTGCLRAGEAANTFVLTASATTNDGSVPATYELDGAEGTNLGDHVGKRIEVTGIIAEQQHVATTEPAKPADEKATGTAGTPTVQTGTQLALRRVQVQQVRPVAGSCE
jgi:hypothetical protein